MTTDNSPPRAAEAPRGPGGAFWRVLLWLGGIFLALILLVAALCALENWRGPRAWADCKRELEAQGEQLDRKAFVPPPVADEQNFAATPLFAALRYREGQGGATEIDWPNDYATAEKEVRKLRKSGARGGGDATPRFTDLTAWQRAFRIVHHGDANQPLPITAPANASAEVRAALEVLEGLKAYDPWLAELREASRRPHARFPVEYDKDNPMDILLPHLAGLRRVSTVLQLRASAELAAGRPDAAWDDIGLLWCLVDSLKDEPILISHLVRNACFQMALVPVREGLARRQWTEAQVRGLQARLEQFDFPAAAQRSLRAERAFSLAALEFILRGPVPKPAQGGGMGDPFQEAQVYRRVAPTGWLCFEEANYCRALQATLLPDSAIKDHRIDPRVVEQKQAELERSLAAPAWKAIVQHRLFCGLLLPALGKIYSKSALAQTLADEAVLACALERFRQANGQFPEKLEALMPAFIPKLPPDVITGEPLHYRQTPDGQFVLWSVGWNGQDDGGVPGQNANDMQHGDWVWEYPPK